MTYPQKIIVLTDIHVRAPGELISGIDPVARLKAVLARATSDHPDAAEIIVMGDLTNEGSTLEFETLRAALPTPCPQIRWMLGNHDRRQPFLNAFPDTPVTPSGFAQQIIDLVDWRLILLDTLDEKAPDMHSGLLCEDRLAWLDAALAGAEDRKVLVFMHHPPYETGFQGMDMIRLRNGPDVISRLKAAQIELLVCGHVHRVISSVIDGVPSAIFKSTCHQLPFDMSPASIHLAVDEPGAYGLLLLGSNGVVVHSVDVD